MSRFRKLVHVNQSDPRDPREPFCGCHDDPWALCPKWEQWGITPEEHEAAERRAAEVHARLRGAA